MRNVLKEIFKLDLILKCFIWAIGYGAGYYIPYHYGCNLVLCIIICFAFGFLFDFIGNKILNTKFYKKNKKNKVIVALGIYLGYIISWFIINNISGHDLDYDFFLNLGLIVIIQLVLLLISPAKEKLVKKIKHKELDEDKLNNVTGGNEPEEFDWREKGYVTPVKDSKSPGWKFEAIANTDGQYFKKTTVENEGESIKSSIGNREIK